MIETPDFETVVTVPADFASVKRAIGFYKALPEKVRPQQWTAYIQVILGVTALCAVLIFQSSIPYGSALALWLSAAAIVLFYGGSYFVFGVGLFIFLFFISVFMGFVIGPAVSLASLASELAVLPWLTHVESALIATVWLWNGISALRKFRLLKVMPDPAKVFRAEVTYLPLFEGITNAAKSYVKMNLFECPTRQLSVTRQDRYLKGTFEILFQTQIPLSPKSSLTLQHMEMKGEVYKYRKQKFKGSRMFERFTLVWSGLNGLDANDVIQRLTGHPESRDYMNAGFRATHTDDKVKITLSRKLKSPNYLAENPKGMLPANSIQRLVAAVSEIHSQTLS